jgi:hypothetical protein
MKLSEFLNEWLKNLRSMRQEAILYHSHGTVKPTEQVLEKFQEQFTVNIGVRMKPKEQI